LKVIRAAASVVLIAVVATVVLAAEPLQKYCVQDQAQEDRLRAMMSDSLDQSFKDHMAHLFDIWVKDQTEFPEHAQVGSNNTISAYIRAQRSLQNWKPQRC
jgi:hypothetical protein